MKYCKWNFKVNAIRCWLNDDLHQGAIFQIKSNYFAYCWLVALSTMYSCSSSVNILYWYINELHCISGTFIFIMVLYIILQNITKMKIQFFDILINTLPIYLTYFLWQLFRVLFVERSFEFIIRILSFSTFFIFLLINYLSLSTNMKTVSQSFIKTYLQK